MLYLFRERENNKKKILFTFYATLENMIAVRKIIPKKNKIKIGINLHSIELKKLHFYAHENFHNQKLFY